MTALDISSFEPLKPRPHQIEAIKKGTEHFSKNRNGKMIMPCGSGKSLTALWISRAMNCHTTVVAIPTLQLQSQMLKAWMKDVASEGSPHRIILIGSDNEVGHEQK